MTRDEILDTLAALLPAQFDALVFRLAIPRAILSGAQAPQLQRAVEIITYLENASQLAAIIPLLRPAPHAPQAPAAAPPPAPHTTTSPTSTTNAPPLTLTDPALEELAEAYDSKNLIVFVGADVSTAAGLPSQEGLVALLLRRALARGAPQSTLDEVTLLAHRNRYPDALSAAEHALGAQDFGAAVERALDDDSHPVPDLAHAIAALAPKLRAVLTTNLDGLLERAFGGKWRAIARGTGDIARRRGYILKLHGTLIEHETWVLTRAQYDHAMYADPQLQGAFSALFNTCPILFVGYGLADDDLDFVLGRVRALAGSAAPRHFALVVADTVTPFRRSQLDQGGIRLIAYDNPDGKHEAVIAVLRGLAARP
jgi:hypothetical protein